MGKKKTKGIIQLLLGKKQVLYYDMNKEEKIFSDLDSFLNYNFGWEGATIFTTLQELNAIYHYVKDQTTDYDFHLIYISQQVRKIIGLGVKKKNSSQTARGITFYDIKYKIGSDQLEVKDALNIIEQTEFKKYNQGYTSKLREQLKFSEPICRGTINNPPSMAPIVYTKTLLEYGNVKCWDITSAYPYLCTQELPHYQDVIDFESIEQFDTDEYTYYGSIEIKNIKAKAPYYPLTLVGKNNKGIKVEDQGENIEHAGVRIISADRVVLNGFIPHLIKILERNYDYESYTISKKLIRFKLEIDQELRTKIIEFFNKKQEKKRNKVNYNGEKILLNRVYGFLLTNGSQTPAHYGQYIVSKQRLIIDSLIHKIGLRDVIHCHTDSIKFIGEHDDVIETYNNTICFPELGRFMLEDVYQKCFYFSHITGKYITKDGKLQFKHGGIDKVGIAHLYKKRYEDVTINTEFYLIRSYFYMKDEGYFPYFITTNFSKKIGDDE